jgi:hypothetical protein
MSLAGDTDVVDGAVLMNDEELAQITRCWDAAARDGGRNLPAGALDRALRLLPVARAWCCSDDGGALFVLGPGEIVFTAAVGEDGTVSVRSRPLQGEQLLVRLEWDEPEGTETGELKWETRWAFLYKDEREAHELWQHIRGSVARDHRRGEHLDQSEQFARAIATKAGWRIAG